MAIEPTLIKPSELPDAPAVYSDDALVVDSSGIVRKATPGQIADAGAPVASEAEAIAGVNNAKRMTPLRVKQVLDNEVAPAVLRAQAWAESPTAPDPLDPTSKSSRTWASEAAISENEAQDHADSAAGFAADALAIKNQLLNDLQADATTLQAGVPATASYDPATLTVSFGIPKGLKGIQGDQGPQGDPGPQGTTDWDDLTNKPAVIAAGSTQDAARTALGLGTLATKNKAAVRDIDVTGDPSAQTALFGNRWGGVLGVGQTWRDMKASRVVDTAYRNTTNGPIFIAICHRGHTAAVQVSADGTTWESIGFGAENANDQNTTSFVLPPGYYYRAATGAIILTWMELRL